MKIYLIEKISSDDIGYDDYSGFVIAAPNEEKARLIAYGSGTGWFYIDTDLIYGLDPIWLDPQKVSCTELDSDTSMGIIQTDYVDG